MNGILDEWYVHILGVWYVYILGEWYVQILGEHMIIFYRFERFCR